MADTQVLSSVVVIPIKYKDILQKVLNEIESETGDMYQITINKFGNYSSDNFILGDFDSRAGSIVEVYDVDPEYKELEGIYYDLDTLKFKIKLLRGNELFHDFKEYTDTNGKTSIIGKCNQCNSYNENNPTRYCNFIDGICQNPNCSRVMQFPKWEKVHIDKYGGTIYTANGGSLSICHNKGKWRYSKITAENYRRYNSNMIIKDKLLVRSSI